MRLLPTRAAQVLLTVSAVLAATAGGGASIAGTPASPSAERGAHARDADPRPNIVVVFTDDMALRDLSAMPHTRRLLARAGTTFDNSHTPFPLCCPDRVTLLTGQYAHNHGVTGNGTSAFPEGGYKGFDSDDNTVATWLHGAGYQTAYVGKYLNGYARAEAETARVPPGWDEWAAAFGDQYDVVQAFEGSSVDGAPPVATHTTYNVYNSTWVTRQSERIIDDRVPDAGPLMMFTSYHAPHVGGPTDSDDPRRALGVDIPTPHPHPGDHNAFAGTQLPRDPSFDEAQIGDKPREIRRLDRFTTIEKLALTELHQQRLESLMSVDRGVRRIVGALRDAGELRNTVVVFTSDNGFLVGQHRVPHGKVYPYEPATRVPLLVRGPGFPAGRHADQLVGAQDLAPTIAALAGVAPTRVVDGVDLSGLARDRGRLDDRDLVIEAGPHVRGGRWTFRGVRTQRWSYARLATGEVELYDLRRDPYQLSNLAGDRAYAAVEQRLAEETAELRDCAGEECLRLTRW